MPAGGSSAADAGGHDREVTYTEATTGDWQELTPDLPARFPATLPYRFGASIGHVASARHLVLSRIGQNPTALGKTPARPLA